MVGDGFEDAFADGAARGTSASWMRARARGDDGMRTATVGSDVVTSDANGDGVGKGKRMVSGPGQKREIKQW